MVSLSQWQTETFLSSNDFIHSGLTSEKKVQFREAVLLTPHCNNDLNKINEPDEPFILDFMNGSTGSFISYSLRSSLQYGGAVSLKG